jgi:hypothetical protein
VLEEYQALGYPILSIRSIPKDRAFLDRFFAEDLRKELVPSPLDINDVWPENYSVNSVQKVWAAKFAARHPNVAVLDLSSFKCGHDAPTYGLIDSIIAAGKTPYSALHDIDANKPTGSIKIRVKTYAHTLMLARERLEDARAKRRTLDLAIARKKLELMERVARERGTSLGLQREMEALRHQIDALEQAAAAHAAAVRARHEEQAHAEDHEHEHGHGHAHGHEHGHEHGHAHGHVLPPTARRAPGLAVIE